MRHLKTIEEHRALNEVFVLGAPKLEDGDRVLAYAQWIWIINDETYPEIRRDIEEKFKMEPDTLDPDNPYSIEDWLQSDDSEDIIYGRFYAGDLSISNYTNFRHGAASTTLMKLMKKLTIMTITIPMSSGDDEDMEFTEFREDITGTLKNQMLYHGTSFKAIPNILKFGLQPGAGESNYGKIRHEDKVFVTLNMEKAYYHATNAAAKEKDAGDFPIIIKVQVPDPDKLVLDYDTAIEYYGKEHPETIRLGYNDIHQWATGGFLSSYDANPAGRARRAEHDEDLNTKFGSFGYRGRIPASHIKGIMYQEEAMSNQIYASEFGESGEYESTAPTEWDEVAPEEFMNVYHAQYEAVMNDFRDEEDGEDDEG
jgi:hypothetical protein